VYLEALLYISLYVISKYIYSPASIINPVIQPPNGVRTPDDELIADRPKEAVTGIDPTKDPIKLHRPKAVIS
jgi:hypothetical protein